MIVYNGDVHINLNMEVVKMNYEKALEDFLNTLPKQRIASYKKPLERFLKYLEIKDITVQDVTAKIINEYTQENQLRKHPLAHFIEYVLNFLRYYGVNIDSKKLNHTCEVSFYYDFELLLARIDPDIRYAVLPNLICQSTFDSFKAVIALEWMGLSLQEISELKMTDVSADGVVIDGNLIPYNEQSVKKLLLEYRASDGYHWNNPKGVSYMYYKVDEYFIRTGRVSNNNMNKIYNILKKGKNIGIDNGLIVESANLNRLYQQEKLGVNVTENFSPIQKNNYLNYKKQLEKYMGA